MFWRLCNCREAILLFKRAITIDEFVYGAHHTEVANDITNLAMCLHGQVRS